jgi:pimeloyl-ACP methyl ester carboxylesterase
MRRVAVVVLLLALSAGPAWGAPATVTMDDGVKLAYRLVEPAGKPPAGGWPGVVLMHGLGGSDAEMAPAARFFAQRGYAALAFSVRGQGGSGGSFGLVSPRDVADMQAMVAWFERRPEVSGRVGCLGISLGGGECWQATPSGIFAAVVPVTTWTELAPALWPEGVARSGVVAALASGLPPSLAGVAANRTLSPALDTTLAQRSIGGARLARVKTPVYLMQGRVDWVFDIDQAVTAFALLGGPRKLYVGDFGHPPSTFSSPDFPGFALDQAARWFDRFLRDKRNGIERPTVLIADRTGRRRTGFAGLPPTRLIHTGPTARAVETFGDSTVRVRVTRVSRYPRLVAVVLAGGRVVTHGAIVPKVGMNTIRLADYAVFVPKGTRISVRLGRDGGAADLAYYGSIKGGSIRLGRVALDLRVLAQPVSR